MEDRPERYELVVKEVDTFNVCFWYKPLKLDKSSFANEEDYYKLLSRLTVLAKKFMIE